jgi:hypothetical protein
MDITFQSLFWFLICTIIYFVGIKPKLTLDMLELPNGVALPNGITTYYSSTLVWLSVYVLMVSVFQFFLNSVYLINKCGGDIGKNIGAAALFTFIPWILIFAVMIAALIMFPGFKTAFSDVIGYYAVSFHANELLSTIIMPADIRESLNQTTNDADKQQLTKAAEAVMKIWGNNSLLINQMNPENFINIWELLTPLMIPGASTDKTKKAALLGLVVLKDNIGEALWYVYTAILISSIVYYNLATRGCIKDINSIKTQQDNYLKQQENIQKQQDINNTTVYTN